MRHVFGAIYFVSIGMLIDLLLLTSHCLALAVLSALAVTGKIISDSSVSTIVGKRSQYCGQHRVSNDADRYVLNPFRAGGHKRDSIVRYVSRRNPR